MKMKTTKQKHIWQIDDVVYFVDETSIFGLFPHIGKGTVHEIHRDVLRVKIGEHDYDYISVQTDKCYNDLDQLFCDLQEHLIRERKRIEKV